MGSVAVADAVAARRPFRIYAAHESPTYIRRETSFRGSGEGSESFRFKTTGEGGGGRARERERGELTAK